MSNLKTVWPIIFNLSLMLLLSGCETTDFTSKRIDNVGRIFKHDTHSYSIFLKPNTDKVNQEIILPYGPYLIISDVPPNADNWVVIRTRKLHGNEIHEIDIHIKDISNIEGGVWEKNSGKSQIKGQTTVLQ